MSELRFVTMPLEDAEMAGVPDVESKRKNVAGTHIIVHYETIEELYRGRGLLQLELDAEGNDIESMPELPYPVKSGAELDDMLNGPEWTAQEELT